MEATGGPRTEDTLAVLLSWWKAGEKGLSQGLSWGFPDAKPDRHRKQSRAS